MRGRRVVIVLIVVFAVAVLGSTMQTLPNETNAFLARAFAWTGFTVKSPWPQLVVAVVGALIAAWELLLAFGDGGGGGTSSTRSPVDWGALGRRLGCGAVLVVFAGGIVWGFVLTNRQIHDKEVAQQRADAAEQARDRRDRAVTIMLSEPASLIREQVTFQLDSVDVAKSRTVVRVALHNASRRKVRLDPSISLRLHGPQHVEIWDGTAFAMGGVRLSNSVEAGHSKLFSYEARKPQGPRTAVSGTVTFSYFFSWRQTPVKAEVPFTLAPKAS